MNLLEIWNGWLLAALCFSPFALVFVIIVIKQVSENQRVLRQAEERLAILTHRLYQAKLEMEQAELRCKQAEVNGRQAAQQYDQAKSRIHQEWLRQDPTKFWREPPELLEAQAEAKRDYDQASQDWSKAASESWRAKVYYDRCLHELEREQEKLHPKPPQQQYYLTEEEIQAEKEAAFACLTVMALGGMMSSDQGPFDT
jgi:multidrug resistance efflux pump